MIQLTRDTRETSIRLTLALGSGASRIATGERFLDHMLDTLARYAGLELDLEASGDLRHHLIEDTAIALGEALRRLTPATCARYGDRTVPMDDALVQAVLDLGGRPFYGGRIPGRLFDHWMRSFATEARATLHLVVLRGEDRHHTIEAAFKALGLALGQALAPGDTVFSTKGTVRVTVTESEATPDPGAAPPAAAAPAAAKGAR
jgi:imidazoleglycerol-phosphate dehydratase